MLLVVFILVSSVLPRKMSLVYAIGTNIYDYYPITETESSKDYPSTTDPDFDISKIEIVSEDESKRTYDSKTFKKTDGTYVLATYNQVIHYEDNGSLKNINNSLTLDKSNGEYENLANKFKIKLPKEINDNKKFKLSLDEYEVEWKVLDISQSEIDIIDNDIKSINIKELSNINQSVLYKNIQPNVDLEYILAGNKIKENIVLNQFIEEFSITFEYRVKNLKLEKNVDGSYAFMNGKNEVIFIFGDLYMIDHKGYISSAVKISVIEIKKDLYKVTITPDQAFLEKAAYPVKVDPSISYGVGDSVLEYKSLLTGGMQTEDIIKVGSVFSAEYRSYFNINMDTIRSSISPSGKKVNIDYAKLHIYIDSIIDGSEFNIVASEVSYPLQYESITDITDVETSEILDYTNIYNYIANDEVIIDFSKKIGEWYERQSQYQVIELKKLYDSPYGEVTFTSIDENICTPFLEIGYSEIEGIRDYWTYNTQNAGRVGKWYVSDYTGYLTFIRNDINFSTELQNLSLTFAYNSLEQDSNTGYGDGWEISYNSRVGYGTTSGGYYIEDFTGYKEYFVTPTVTNDLECDINSSDYDCLISMDDGKKELRRYISDDNTDFYELYEKKIQRHLPIIMS